MKDPPKIISVEYERMHECRICHKLTPEKALKKSNNQCPNCITQERIRILHIVVGLILIFLGIILY